MNILPLILMLILMLSVLTVEKLGTFKNQFIAQKQYQIFLKESERKVFNQRQQALFGIYQKNIKQLTFRYLIDKTARSKHEKAAAQYRLLLIELMKILYGEASFFKKLQQKRSAFLEEMVDLIQRAADAAPEKLINQVEDIVRLNLNDPDIQGDPELHEAFYHMLKGTMPRLSKEEMEEKEKEEEPLNKEKAYVSLFEFINYDGKDDKVPGKKDKVSGKKDKVPGEEDKVPKIMIQMSPREILMAIFEDEGVVESIIVRRNELAKQKDSGASETFKYEFIGKRREGIEDDLLDFEITFTSKTEYN